jgi:hypothetical protein
LDWERVVRSVLIAVMTIAVLVSCCSLPIPIHADGFDAFCHRFNQLFVDCWLLWFWATYWKIHR